MVALHGWVDGGGSKSLTGRDSSYRKNSKMKLDGILMRVTCAESLGRGELNGVGWS